MMKQMGSGQSTIILKTIILLFVWVPCSESRPLATSSRYRERRDAIHFEDFDADAVHVISNNAYEKAPDTDFILQTGLSRNLDDERRNIQPRRISGFALINFVPDSAYSVTTPKPETTVVNPFTLSSSVTFSNLVERARQQYGQTPAFQPQTEASSPSTVTSTPTSIFSGTSTQKTHPSFKDSSLSRSISRYRGQNSFRSKKRRPQTSQYRIDQLRKTTNRFIRRQYRVHASQTSRTTPTTTTSEPTTPDATTTQPPPTTVPSPQIFTNVETASAYLVTRNVSSTRVVTEPSVPLITTEAISVFETTISSRKQRQNDEAYSQTYDYYYSDAPTTTLDYEESESKRTTPIPSTTSTPPLSTTTGMTTTDTENAPVTTNWLPGLETSDRSPRTSDVDAWTHEDDNQHLDREEETVFSGQYFEKNPGKYLENNPGQYFEDNPGQYFEDNPGQYYDAPYAGQYQEVSPGQYYETNPGQYNDNLDVQVVKVKHLNDAQVYNVQSKVDNFIIGEYGTISKNDGQTIQGVRYTAVDDQSIDPKIIYETLQKYFPMVQFDEEDHR